MGRGPEGDRPLVHGSSDRHEHTGWEPTLNNRGKNRRDKLGAWIFDSFLWEKKCGIKSCVFGGDGTYIWGETSKQPGQNWGKKCASAKMRNKCGSKLVFVLTDFGEVNLVRHPPSSYKT